jgi:hypothetical protein
MKNIMLIDNQMLRRKKAEVILCRATLFQNYTGTTPCITGLITTAGEYQLTSKHSLCGGWPECVNRFASKAIFQYESILHKSRRRQSKEEAT